ncbi:hypothetical protein NP233_g1085 [Leucocoprinus birnbaumii]|uniref:pyranose dehydrogenase (acceptor) n=1 Tax=Leucocoprinus birnbaumii TaxID=56174 RepID=A0AAD5W4N6_9AGAR|nr:hypothetical protein NP233_g1085 [Leucocoprinus birnbaumii]
MWHFLVCFLALALVGSTGGVFHSDASTIANLEFDFIVVGGGTAGSVVASRLTENSKFQVLVIEAGPSNQQVLDSEVPFDAFSLGNTRFDWNFTSTPQSGLGGRVVPYTRGHILGGSSSINSMFYTRGSSDDYDRLARLSGDSGWSWNNIQTYIRRNERWTKPADQHNTNGQFDPSIHGFSGMTLVSLPGFAQEIDDMVIKTTKQLSQEFPFNLDMNSGKPLGLGWLQSTIGDGTRSSAATSYLNSTVTRRPNLHILLETRVTRILPTAGDQLSLRTVEVLSSSGATSVFNASKEVILSAGTIGTPTILLHSGVGDKTELEKLGITSVLDLLDVGKNLTDQPVISVNWATTSQDPFDGLLLNTTLKTQELAVWELNRTGPLVTVGINHVAWLRLPDNSPIFQVFPDPSAGPKTPHVELAIGSGMASFVPGHFVGVGAATVTPLSRGTVRLNSSDVLANPLIDPAMLSSEFDVQALRESIKSAKRFFAAPAWKGFVQGIAGPVANATSDQELEDFVRSTAFPSGHIVGTAAMSAQGARHGVVDPDLRLKHVSGLRIVDASVLLHSWAVIDIRRDTAAFKKIQCTPPASDSTGPEVVRLAMSHNYRPDGILEVSPSASHPIHNLIKEAENRWHVKRSKASRNIREAYYEYQRRYGRLPPKGFDEWWNYVQEHSVQLPDEYDQIWLDLEPFWGMDPVELNGLRREHEAHSESFTIGKVDGGPLGVVNKSLTNPDLIRGAEHLLSLLRSIEEHLPAFRAIMSPLDNPYGLVDYDVKHALLKAAGDKRHLKVENLPPSKASRGWMVACGEQNTSATVDEFTGRTFIHDHHKSMDPCLHPKILDIHGQFLSYNGHPPGPDRAMVPKFTYCSTSLHHDIRIPNAGSWVEDLPHNPEWEDRPDERLAWRGRNTGIWHTPDNKWRDSQRPRAVNFANRMDGAVNVLFPPPNRDDPVGEGVEVSRSKLNPALFDVAFVESPLQCQKDYCHEIERMFEWRRFQDAKEAGNFKYVLDVDGNGWSSRFQRLLISNALVFKATIYPEWFIDRIEPWVHYVPIGVDLGDLYDSLLFFRGDPLGKGSQPELARNIAQNGRKWAKEFWRKEDMTAYIFRVRSRHVSGKRVLELHTMTTGGIHIRRVGSGGNSTQCSQTQDIRIMSSYLPIELIQEIISASLELTSPNDLPPGLNTKPPWSSISSLSLTCKTIRKLVLEAWFCYLYTDNPNDTAELTIKIPEVQLSWVKNIHCVQWDHATGRLVSWNLEGYSRLESMRLDRMSVVSSMMKNPADVPFVNVPSSLLNLEFRGRFHPAPGAYDFIPLCLANIRNLYLYQRSIWCSLCFLVNKVEARKPTHLRILYNDGFGIPVHYANILEPLSRLEHIQITVPVHASGTFSLKESRDRLFWSGECNSCQSLLFADQTFADGYISRKQRGIIRLASGVEQRYLRPPSLRSVEWILVPANADAARSFLIDARISDSVDGDSDTEQEEEGHGEFMTSKGPRTHTLLQPVLIYRSFDSMVSFKVLAGGYDVFIATYLFDSEALSLSVASRSPTGNSPSWISRHPTNSSILYAVNEVANGAVQSFVINSDGSLSQAVSSAPSGGDNPAFAVALSTGAVAAMNYNTGDGRVIPTTNTGLAFNQNSPVIHFPIPNSPTSHPHMVLEHDGEILVTDLGEDMIWRLSPDASGSYSITGSIPSARGSGPRHMAIYDDRLFVLHELSSTLSVQAIPSAPNGTSTIISDVSIIPPNPPSGAAFAAGEILIPEPTDNFPTPYIYTSNRNTGVQDPRGDSIAIFELVNKGQPNETLQLVNQVYTGIDQIRGMEFGPSANGGEEFLIAAGVAGNAGTMVFRRTEGGRNMEKVATNLDIPTRTTFLWIE